MDWKFEEGRIYSNDENGELLCEATYVQRENGELNIDHTYVNPKLRGQGVASQMMRVVAEHFKKEGYKTSATCSYANTWLKRHQTEYSEIISDSLKDEAAACKIDRRN